jgi:hypothetical protein
MAPYFIVFGGGFISTLSVTDYRASNFWVLNNESEGFGEKR